MGFGLCRVYYEIENAGKRWDDLTARQKRRWLKRRMSPQNKQRAGEDWRHIYFGEKPIKKRRN